jgi:PAS domain S-box-containing protein
MKIPELNASESLFAGGGKMGRIMRATDWAKSALGRPEDWSPALRMMTKFLLANRFPQLLWWGPQFCSIYNDAYSPILGTKHPWALGRPVSEVWKEIWQILKPLIETPFCGGPATWMEHLPLEINRCGFFEETHFTVAYSPVPDETAPNGIGGVLATVHEITEKVIGERRVHALRDLGARSAEPKSIEQACSIIGDTLSAYSKDIPFLLIYSLDEKQQTARVACCVAAESNDLASPALIDLGSESNEPWPVSVVRTTGQIQVVTNLEKRFKKIPQGPWPDPPTAAAVLPVRSSLQGQLAGFMIAGLSSRIHFDENYRDFLNLLSNQVATMIANARAYEQERKRAEALAELDKAKTTFFSNVSHELRTPLTLMLGPTESALSSTPRVLAGSELDMVHRNELRLLKLVNTLLDFSRIEAGRAQAIYEPTDLVKLTEDIASAFRSAMEKAGLRFSVCSEAVDELIYVDREMWEKIVMNLLSNAFKFTVEGEVELSLKPGVGCIELIVRDTGIGIPEYELPHLFERFHRVENARARTYEGTGIGLALVYELVKLHGGAVRVESTLDRGSSFTVSIPRGLAHLPPDRIGGRRTLASTAVSADAYINEANRWLPDTTGDIEGRVMKASPGAELPAAAAEKKDVIVIADDNADMREYLVRLLHDHYTVHAVRDGAEAVDAIRQLRPALVLTDVMMPRLDGFGVLQEIRRDDSLKSTPVILLSARAGEESRVEGLHAGADDYLVKPFTANELIARVATHVKMAALRRETEKALRESEERFRAFVNASSDVVYRMSPDWSTMRQLDGRGFILDTQQTRKNWIDVYIDPSDQPLILKAIRHAIETKSVFELEHRVRRVDGTLAWTLSRAVPLLDKEGNIVEWLGAATDVSARKSDEEARRRLAAIVESSGDAIVSKDLNGIVTSWNRQAERLFGYQEEEMIGRSILRIIPPELHGDEDMILSKIRSGQKIDHFETVRIAKSGERIEVSLSISPVRDEHGKIVGAAKIARDIRESKKIEKALRTTEKLAAAGRLAATVAHEINNPLEAIANLVYLAKRDLPHPEKVASHLNSAKQELSRVAHITRQTLGFYRDASSPGRFNVPGALDDLLRLYERRFETRNIRVVKHYDDDADVVALGGEIRQALSNLVTNALDAMPSGGILALRVRKAREWSNAQLRGIRITIADSGSGIAPKDKQSLFQPFFTTKTDVGTGLGLWITRGIVEKHGGSIRVKSRTGANHGTIFSIFLPSDAKPRLEQWQSGAVVENELVAGD